MENKQHFLLRGCACIRWKNQHDVDISFQHLSADNWAVRDYI